MLIEGECSRCQCQTDSLFHWLLIILSHLSFIFGPWVTQFFAFTKDFNCLFFAGGGEDSVVYLNVVLVSCVEQSESVIRVHFCL